MVLKDGLATYLEMIYVEVQQQFSIHYWLYGSNENKWDSILKTIDRKVVEWGEKDWKNVAKTGIQSVRCVSAEWCVSAESPIM